eukprot:768719-Pyramimonas_sp.AAC.1
MQAYNTHEHRGYTWFGIRGKTSHIDYILAPPHLPGVRPYFSLHYSARRLQLHAGAGKRDHVTIQIVMRAAPHQQNDISRQISRE